MTYFTGTVQWKISGDTEKARRELTGLALKWLHHARDAKHLGNFGYFDTGWKHYPEGNIRVISNLGTDMVFMDAVSGGITLLKEKPQFAFYPAFKAQIDSTHQGLIIADWKTLESIEWAEADTENKNLENKPYIFITEKGTKYYLVPQVPVASALIRTSGYTEGVHNPNYSYLTLNFVARYVNTMFMITDGNGDISGPLEYIDDNYDSLTDIARCGFFEPDELTNTVSISGTSRNIARSSIGYYQRELHNAGAYYAHEHTPFRGWQPDHSDESIPGLVNYNAGGKRSKLTKRSLLYHTDNYQEDYYYNWGLHELGGIFYWTTNLKLDASVYSGVSTLKKWETYTVTDDSYVPSNPTNLTQTQKGPHIVHAASNIFFMPSKIDFVKNYQGIRFPDTDEYEKYNTNANEAKEVAILVLDYYDINIYPGVAPPANVYPCPYISTTYDGFQYFTKYKYYAICHGKADDEKFVSRLILDMELFENKYTYLKDMYVVVKEKPTITQEVG
jgi:hypothetical protein